MPNPPCAAVRATIYCLILLATMQVCALHAKSQSNTRIKKGQSPSFALWGDLNGGTYAVGFKHLDLYDYARTYRTPIPAPNHNAAQSRPVPASIWYPAVKPSQSSFMPFEEYVFAYNATLAGSYKGLTLEDKTRLRSEYAAQTFAEVSFERVTMLLDTATATIKDAAPDSSKRFPVVLYAPGWGSTPLNHTVTCEYLASHGYIVVSTPARGTNSVMTLGIRDVEAQARDLEFMLAQLHDFPNADTTRVATVGFSLGDAAALLVAMRNENVHAVVSLDGTTGFSHFQGLHAQSTSFDTGRMRAAFLYMNAQGKAFTDIKLINSFKYADRYILSFKGFGHTDFIARKMIARIPTNTIDANYKQGYEAVCEYTRRFLNAYTKTESDNRQAPDMQPTRVLAAKDFLITQSFKALAPPPTEEEFAQSIMESGGITKARQIYAKIKRENPEAVFFREAMLEALAVNLLDAKRTKEAIEVCLLNVEAHPQSFRAHNNLGEAYAANDDKELAIRSYSTALKLKPNNVEAIEALKELVVKPTP